MTPEQLRDELERDDATLQEVLWITSRYQRHTVDIRGPAPHQVEDELLAFEKGWRRAKVARWVIGVLVVGYVVWRVVHGSAG